MDIAGAEYDPQGESGDSIEKEERVVHVLVEVAVEHAQLLMTVGRIIGGVHIDNDPGPGIRMHLNIEVYQPVTQSTEVFSGYPVLKSAERRLTGQPRGGLGKLPGYDFKGRIMAKGINVVRIFITKSNRKDTLLQKGRGVMTCPVRVAGITEAVGGSMSKVIALVDLSKQKAASIRGHLTAVKTNRNLLVEKTFKFKLFMADCFHKGISCLWSLFCNNNTLDDALYFFKP
jgi:hypothetical protein